MSTHRPHRIDRFTAERLLRGETAGPDQLAELLTATAPPGERGLLAGEETAVAAFREAHLVPAPQLRKRSMIKTALAKLLTLKVAAVALTATATAAGGVTLAAGSGHLPESLGGAAPTARPTPTHTTGKTSATRDGHPNASPSASLNGLCHAYQAGAGDSSGKALNSPAFTYLITVAGGKDKVAAYCADLKTHVGKAHDSHPTGAPTTHPSGASATHPAGGPTTHPSGAPATHPAGAPTTHPTGAPATHPGH
jgi:hypothetical protein